MKSVCLSAVLHVVWARGGPLGGGDFVFTRVSSELLLLLLTGRSSLDVSVHFPSRAPQLSLLLKFPDLIVGAFAHQR